MIHKAYMFTMLFLGFSLGVSFIVGHTEMQLVWAMLVVATIIHSTWTAP